MLISNKGHNNTIQVYSANAMTHVIALEAGQSSQGTFEPITPASRLIILDLHVSDSHLHNWVHLFFILNDSRKQ